MRTRVAAWCPSHGKYEEMRCPRCDAVTGGKVGPNVITNEWVRNQTWEHIDPTNPHMKFDSKRELIRACESRGLLVKAFMKPKSQGAGYEHK